MVGGVFAYAVFPREVIKTKEVPVEVEVEKIVEVENLVEVEVEKDFDSYKNDAVELCLEEFLDDYDLDKYQEAEVSKVSDDWSISFDEIKDKLKTIVEITNLRIKVLDTLEDDRETYDGVCKVVYREDKEPKVTYSVI
ncbi:MAG TPA: hypothetical protein VGB37_12710 [Candidatus Lokiarchaeia archaeon]